MNPKPFMCSVNTLAATPQNSSLHSTDMCLRELDKYKKTGVKKDKALWQSHCWVYIYKHVY